MRTKSSLPIAIFLILFINSCSEEEGKPQISADFNVSHLTEFNNSIYPSLIFGLTEIEKQQGEAMNYFTIDVSPNIETDLRIIVEESKLNFETVITESNLTGETQIIASLKWKYDELKNLTQPGNIDITFVCYTGDNKEIDSKVCFQSI